MRSSITEARKRLERDVLPRATDYQRRQAEDYLKAVEAKAAQVAGERIASLAEQVTEMRRANLEALTTARDEAETIRRDLDAGRTTTAQASGALSRVRADRETAEDRLGKAAALVETVAEIESDPIAYFDELTRGTPRIQETWPW